MKKNVKTKTKKTPKRVKKREDVGPGRPPKEHQFSKDNQPTPEAKSAGWERKRGADAIKDAFLRYSAMPMAELSKLIKKIAAQDYTDLDGNPLTAADIHAIRHATDKKYTIDYMNRGLEYVKQPPVDLEAKVSISVTYADKPDNPEIPQTGAEQSA